MSMGDDNSGDRRVTLYVQLINGTTIPLSVGLHFRVVEFKNVIFRKVNIPVDQQQLMYLGNTLDDTKTLQNYNLKDGCAVQLFGQVSPTVGAEGADSVTVDTTANVDIGGCTDLKAHETCVSRTAVDPGGLHMGAVAAANVGGLDLVAHDSDDCTKVVAVPFGGLETLARDHQTSRDVGNRRLNSTPTIAVEGLETLARDHQTSRDFGNRRLNPTPAIDVGGLETQARDYQTSRDFGIRRLNPTRSIAVEGLETLARNHQTSRDFGNRRLNPTPVIPVGGLNTVYTKPDFRNPYLKPYLYSTGSSNSSSG